MIRLVLPLPPSANRMYRSQIIRGRPTSIKSEVYRGYEGICGKEVMAQAAREVVPEGLLSFSAWMFWGDRRRRDTDNYIKVLQDVVSRTLGFDDFRISEVHVFRRHDKDNARCIVEIQEVLR